MEAWVKQQEAGNKLRTLCQRQQKVQGTHTVPGRLPQDAVDIDQEKHLLDHFVGSLTTIAKDGFAMMKFFDAIFINTKACCPNSEQHCNKLARDAKGIAVALVELKEAGTKLGRIDDRICTKEGRVRAQLGGREAE
jgi:hypothetical protein